MIIRYLIKEKQPTITCLDTFLNWYTELHTYKIMSRVHTVLLLKLTLTGCSLCHHLKTLILEQLCTQFFPPLIHYHRIYHFSSVCNFFRLEELQRRNRIPNSQVNQTVVCCSLSLLPSLCYKSILGKTVQCMNNKFI